MTEAEPFLTCRECNLSKTRGDFSHRQRSRTVRGQRPICRDCMAARTGDESARESAREAIGVFRAADERRRHTAAQERHHREAEAARARIPWPADP